MEGVVGDLDSGEDGQFENDGDDCTGESPPAVVDNNGFLVENDALADTEGVPIDGIPMVESVPGCKCPWL